MTHIENTGSEDLVYLEMFKTSKYTDISLNDWMTHIPPELVREHLGISDDVLRSIPKANIGVLPR
jgi:oxalate decarboxylase